MTAPLPPAPPPPLPVWEETAAEAGTRDRRGDRYTDTDRDEE
ncbi:hypothetical protein [Streptomyces sp. NPDC056188]